MRITLPQHEYQLFNPDECPFKMDISKMAITIPDTNSLAEPCWWYIYYPTIHAQVYLTYKPVGNEFNKLTEDSRSLVYRHTQKANAINEELISNSNGSTGILYHIEGNAASSVQFYLTDSTRHFLRGALYFNCPPNSDSLAPVVHYISNDISRMLSTLEWK